MFFAPLEAAFKIVFQGPPDTLVVLLRLTCLDSGLRNRALGRSLILVVRVLARSDHTARKRHLPRSQLNCVEWADLHWELLTQVLHGHGVATTIVYQLKGSLCEDLAEITATL